MLNKTENKGWNFRELLTYVDVFGIPHSIYLNGKQQYRSTVGAFLTIGVGVLLILLCVPEIEVTFGQKNIEFNEETQFKNSPGALNLNFDNFRIAINLDDPSLNFSYSMVGVNFILGNYTRNSEGVVNREKTTVSLRPCTSDLFNDFQSEYMTLGLNTALCTENISYPIQGTFLDTIYQFVEIDVGPCTNSTYNTSGITCAPNDTAVAYLINNKVRLQVFFISNSFNP